MATCSSLCLTLVCSFKSSNKPGGVLIGSSRDGNVLRVNEAFEHLRVAKNQSWEIKASDGKPTTKINSTVCKDCEGNGVRGRFCVECNGAGFLGGFMSTQDS